jgi:hypothetical protein
MARREKTYKSCEDGIERTKVTVWPRMTRAEVAECEKLAAAECLPLKHFLRRLLDDAIKQAVAKSQK